MDDFWTERQICFCFSLWLRQTLKSHISAAEAQSQWDSSGELAGQRIPMSLVRRSYVSEHYSHLETFASFTPPPKSFRERTLILRPEASQNSPIPRSPSTYFIQCGHVIHRTVCQKQLRLSPRPTKGTNLCDSSYSVKLAVNQRWRNVHDGNRVILVIVVLRAMV